METRRTILVRPTADDYEDVLRLQRDERARRYLGGPTAEEDFSKKFAGILITCPPESHWIIRQKDTNVFMGLVSISQYYDGVHYEVSYEIEPAFWGDGYGTEVVQKIINYAFSVMGLDEIYAETQRNNVSSVRLLEKVGMHFRTHIKRFGEDQVVYLIRRI